MVTASSNNQVHQPDIQPNEIKEIFGLFDKSSSGFVRTQELGTLIRAINLNPSEAEIIEMMKKVDPNSSGQFNLQSLENLIRHRGKDPDTLQDVIDALKVFDSDHDGKISVSEFTYAMTNMGEQMNAQEIQEIIADSQLVNNDHINVEDFARMIMNRI